MEGIGWLGVIVVGGLAGALAGRFVSGHGFGIFLNVVIGILGGIIGGWITTRIFNISGSGYVFSFLVALLGAVILLYVLRLIAGGRRRI